LGSSLKALYRIGKGDMGIHGPSHSACELW
jgi:hypothetical protein